MSYTLKDPQNIAYFDAHPELNFDKIVSVFVGVLNNLGSALQTGKDSHQYQVMMKDMLERISAVDARVIKQNEHVEAIQSHLNESKKQVESHLSSLVHHQMEALLQNMREMMKSNQGDSEQRIFNVLQEKNQLFLNRIEELTKQTHLQEWMLPELNKVNTFIDCEMKKMIGLFERQSSDEIIRRMESVFASKYGELDSAIRARLESMQASSQTNSSTMYSEILSRLEKSSGAIEVVGTYFSKQIGSNTKGKTGEAKLELLLSQMYPSGLITNTSGQTSAGDFILERNGKSKILLDNKDYDTVVPVKEVEKILYDMDKQGCHGILISQHSGIAQKGDFEINIHNQHMVVFLHNGKYNSTKLALAVNVIDHMECMLSQEVHNNEELISADILAQINKEYQEMASQKINLIQSIKKSQQDLVLQVQRMDLPSLTTYLETKFANTGKTGFPCDICKSYMGKNAKSLAAHRRACVKNHPPPDVVVNTTE